MATKTTYLVVSDIDDIGSVKGHSSISESGLTHRETSTRSDERVPSITFAVEQALDEEEDLVGPARQVSAEFPEATIVLCEVEERFDQVERLQTMVFINGKNAGDIEHGYIFNVGKEG